MKPLTLLAGALGVLTACNANKVDFPGQDDTAEPGDSPAVIDSDEPEDDTGEPTTDDSDGGDDSQASDDSGQDSSVDTGGGDGYPWSQVSDGEYEVLGAPPGARIRSMHAEGDTILAGALNATFLSEDAGQTWSRVDDSGVFTGATDVAVFGGELWAVTSAGLLHSTDDGASWVVETTGMTDTSVSEVATDGATLYALSSTGWSSYSINTWDTSAGEWVPTRLTQPVMSLSLNGATLWASSSYGAGAMYSQDGGATWTTTTGVGTVVFTHILELSDGSLLAGGQRSYRSTDSGRTWQQLSSLSMVTRFVEHDGAVYAFASSYLGVMKSTDSGVTWTDATGDLPGGFSQWISDALVADGDLLIGTYGPGFFRSGDGGGTWVPANDGVVATSVATLAFEPDGAVWVGAGDDTLWRLDAEGGGWEQRDDGMAEGAQIYGLTVSQGSLVAGTIYDGVLRSDDSGLSWADSSTDLTRYNGTAGLQHRETAALDARGADVWLAHGTSYETFGGSQGPQSTGGGVSISSDGGRTWQRSNTGLTVQGRNAYNEVYYSPMYTVRALDGFVMLSSMSEGIYVSPDGASWTFVGAMPATTWGTLALAADFAEADGVYYVAVWGQDGDVSSNGVMYSEDGYAWRWVNAGLPSGHPIKGIDSADGVVFAVAEGTQGGVFRLDADAAQWSALGDAGQPVSGPLRVDGEHLYVGTTDRGLLRFTPE